MLARKIRSRIKSRTEQLSSNERTTVSGVLPSGRMYGRYFRRGSTVGHFGICLDHCPFLDTTTYHTLREWTLRSASNSDLLDIVAGLAMLQMQGSLLFWRGLPLPPLHHLNNLRAGGSRKASSKICYAGFDGERPPNPPGSSRIAVPASARVVLKGKREGVLRRSCRMLMECNGISGRRVVFAATLVMMEGGSLRLTEIEMETMQGLLQGSGLV